MIISYPLLQLKGRNIALEKKFNISSTKNCELLNKEIECISRVVIHPKYRAIGLAHRMINHYLNNMTKARYVETVAVMAKYNPFFEKAGMKLIKTNNVDQRYNDIIKRISELGFDINLIKSLNYVKSIYEKLIYEDKQEFNKICKELYKRFSGLFSNEFKYQENDKLFENSKFLSIFHRMLKSDIQYLIFDNSDKYNLEQNKKIDLNNIFKKEEDRLENLENVRKGENNEKHRTDSIR